MNPAESPVPLLGFVAYSGTGKTSLLEQLLPRLVAKGLRIAVLKHAHHDFDIDIPGKDSYRLRHAGARQTLVASHRRWALITEQPDCSPEPRLGELLEHLDHSELDLILVEGFKHEAFPKVELHRAALSRPHLFTQDEHIVALACDIRPQPEPPLPCLDLNDLSAIAQFVVDFSHKRATQ